MKSAAERKAFVIEAFDTLFNKRDYKAAEAYWSPKYIQHSAHIPPGREGLFDLVKAMPAELRYEHGLVVAEEDFVFLHSRFSGIGPRALITVDCGRRSRRTLGCMAGRGLGERFEERSAHVRRKVSGLVTGTRAPA